MADPAGRAQRRVLLGPHHLPGQREPPLTVRPGRDLPALPDPAAAAQLALPCAPGLDRFVFAARPAEAQDVRVRAHEVLRQPRPGAPAQLLVLGPEAEIHAALPASYALGRSLAAAALAMASSCASIGIGSVPTVPGRKSAIFSGVQEPSAYPARSSRGCAQTAIFGPAIV